MKKYDILDIALKLFGISLAISIFHYYVLATFIGALYQFPGDRTASFSDWLLTIAALALYLFPSWLLIFRTPFIIKILKVKKEDESVDLNMQGNILIEMALIIIGGIELVKTIPHCITLIFEQIRANKFALPFDHTDNTKWITNDIIIIILSVFLIIYSRPLGIYFSKFREKNKLNSTE